MSGKTGFDVPAHEIAIADPEVFAAYTAPDGGLTSVTKIEDRLSATSMQEADHSEDFDYIDLDEIPTSGRKRNSSASNMPTLQLESNISKRNILPPQTKNY